MVWGLIIGAGISAYGQYQQKKATDSANAANDAQTAQAQGFLSQGKTDAISAQKQGITFADESYQKAIGVASTIGEASRSRTLRREKEYQGAADASSANRGLYNSTQAQNAQRGVMDATNQTLASIDESVAGLVAQIHQNRGRTMLQGQSQLAGLYQQFSAAQAGIANSVVHQANPNIAANYGKLGMGIGQMLMEYEYMNKDLLDPNSGLGPESQALTQSPGQSAGSMTLGSPYGAWQGAQQFQQSYGPQPSYSFDSSNMTF